ncbi:hypothetical protein K469DRAFT_690518 [Zopfia rhizophila CBS 207.26]|uniref:Uncharacterized protein n=1 Tax=Zopfia rhizophila CBS 207.26 TaxID=1314779 RepID=A0A6A6DUR1_9PEZI|nr:hypothetical protein K469DRAFT_690518 [Zopfia rhizophila CBS 207.26]
MGLETRSAGHFHGMPSSSRRRSQVPKEGEDPEHQIYRMLIECGVNEDLALKVELIAKTVSYAEENKNPAWYQEVLQGNPELAVVQDADRLDALGSIGQRRCFAYSGANPDLRQRTIQHTSIIRGS